MRGIVAAAVATLILAPAAAHADQLEPADRNVDTVRVTYVEPVGARGLFVELNNGAVYRLQPCRYEDSRHCYWDADSRGNGIGRSFIRVSGRIVFSRMVGDAR